MTDTGFSRADKATQLVAFLSGDPIARKRFPETYHKGILKQAKRLMSLYGTDLDPGLAEDVVQTFWLSLLKAAPDVFRADGSADGFIRSRLQTAIRDVRESYPPPDQAARLPKKGSAAAQKRLPAPLSLDTPMPGVEDSATLGDVSQHPRDRIAESDERVSLTQTLALMEETAPTVSQALTLMWENDLSLSKAAQAVNVHHMSLRRSLDAWTCAHPDYFC